MNDSLPACVPSRALTASSPRPLPCSVRLGASAAEKSPFSSLSNHMMVLRSCARRTHLSPAGAVAAAFTRAQSFRNKSGEAIAGVAAADVGGTPAGYVR